VIDVLVLLVVLVGAAAAGAALLRVLDAEPAAPDERLLTALAAGLAVTSLVTLALTALHLVSPLSLGLAWLAALGAGGRHATAALRAVEWQRLRRAWPVLAVCGLVLLAETVAMLAPPIGGDQTKYQLAYPRLYADAGGLVRTPWTFWGQQQFLQNFLFVAGFVLRGEELAALVNAATGVLATVAVATLVRRHLALRAGAIAGMLFFTLPMAWSQMARVGADMTVVMYGALAMTAVLDWARSARTADLLRAGLMAGLAGGTKVMGLLLPTLVGLVVLGVLAARRLPLGRAFGLAMAFGVIVLAAALPFYVRNTVETGDPMYPFGYGAFGGANWSADAAAYLDLYYRQYQTLHALRRGASPYVGLVTLRFPWDLTMYPESFENTARSAYDVSPFILAFVPTVMLVRRRRWAAWIVAAVGVAFVAVIAGGAWAHPRYVLMGLVLCLAAAVAGCQALCGERGLRLVAALTVAGNLALTATIMRSTWPDQLRVALGRLDDESFLRRHSERFVFWERSNQIIPPDGRVAVLAKIPHPYDIHRPFVLLSFLEQGLFDYRTADSPDDLARVLDELQVTHVAIDVAALDERGDPFETRVEGLWRAFAAAQGPPLVEERGWALYALAPRRHGQEAQRRDG
jgi:hypothetical protein